MSIDTIEVDLLYHVLYSSHSHEDVLDFVKEIDRGMDDYKFTFDLCKYVCEEMIMDDFEGFKKYVLDLIDKKEESVRILNELEEKYDDS